MSATSDFAASPAPVDHGPALASDLELGLPGFRWSDLDDPTRLAELTAAFDDALRAKDPALFGRYAAWREAGGAGLAPPAQSELLVEIARHVSRFLARLFRVEDAVARLAREVEREAPVLRLRELVKRARKKHPDLPGGEAARLDPEVDALVRTLLPGEAGAPPPLLSTDRELAVARLADRLAETKDERLALVERWAAACALEGHPAVRGWVSFRLPHPVRHEELVPIRRPDPALPEALVGAGERRRRDGFKLTDRRMRRREVLAEVDYCILCHPRQKDSCSRGFLDPSSKAGTTKPERTYKKNALGIPLTGCPLEERISEMHALVREGDMVGALALITVDNPMAPGTGHRICNDCMKGCIYQKQEPVNIPQVETRALVDVLHLPYGFEIYALLTRWNPLRAKRPHPAPYNGKNILVVGLGPAGYTLSHHLVNEGFGVVAIDGLKIEPLPEELLNQPVREFAALQRELDERVLAGFGGVAEYGITVRWDKNFLTVIHLTLARRRLFKAYGGVRFGGTLTLEDAWRLGFDHVAIAAGAGKPTVVELENNLIRGVRKASDFLMALNLGGAFKKGSMSNLQVRLPAVIIGGGLTAVDAATEIAAYYPVQVEKILERFEELARTFGEDRVFRMYDDGEKEKLREFLEHGRAVRAERARAQAAGEAPNFAALVEKWGGVTIAYRKRLLDSPAYRLNHEEVVKCLEEGIRFLENVSPVKAVPGPQGAVESLVVKRKDGSLLTLPARAVIVAAGTSPNVIYEREAPGTFLLDPKRASFLPHKWVDGALVPGEGFFTGYRDSAGHTVTFYGDNHPTYAGSVVKAMASAKDGYPHVVALFAQEIRRQRPEDQPARDTAWRRHIEQLDDLLVPRVVRVNRLTPTIVEVVVRAPLAARRFQPGQFYRLQNYEANAPVVRGTTLAMEGLALTGAWVDRDKGLLALIVLEMGGSSRLCAALRPGEPVVVMGPTGAPSEIPRGEKVLLAGGGLGNAVLFSIARALKENGCTVLYFAGYRKKEDVFKMDEIEAGTDQVIWSVDAGEPIQPRRKQDRAFVGNIVAAMLAFAKGELGEHVVELAQVDRIIAIGSDRMMGAVARARHGILAPYLRKEHVAIASINSPMQCMMKEVCAQCLCRQVDPATGAPAPPVFSCFNQDQEMDRVDWQNLSDRLKVNSVQEKLANLWLDRLLLEKNVMLV